MSVIINRNNISSKILSSVSRNRNNYRYVKEDFMGITTIGNLFKEYQSTILSTLDAAITRNYSKQTEAITSKVSIDNTIKISFTEVNDGDFTIKFDFLKNEIITEEHSCSVRFFVDGEFLKLTIDSQSDKFFELNEIANLIASYTDSIFSLDKFNFAIDKTIKFIFDMVFLYFISLERFSMQTNDDLNAQMKYKQEVINSFLTYLQEEVNREILSNDLFKQFVEIEVSKEKYTISVTGYTPDKLGFIVLDYAYSPESEDFILINNVSSKAADVFKITNLFSTNLIDFLKALKDDLGSIFEGAVIPENTDVLVQESNLIINLKEVNKENNIVIIEMNGTVYNYVIKPGKVAEDVEKEIKDLLSKSPTEVISYIENNLEQIVNTTEPITEEAELGTEKPVDGNGIDDIQQKIANTDPEVKDQNQQTTQMDVAKTSPEAMKPQEQTPPTPEVKSEVKSEAKTDKNGKYPFEKGYIKDDEEDADDEKNDKDDEKKDKKESKEDDAEEDDDDEDDDEEKDKKEHVCSNCSKTIREDEQGENIPIVTPPNVEVPAKNNIESPDTKKEGKVNRIKESLRQIKESELVDGDSIDDIQQKLANTDPVVKDQNQQTTQMDSDPKIDPVIQNQPTPELQSEDLDDEYEIEPEYDSFSGVNDETDINVVDNDRYCTNCGSEVDNTFGYCPKCGSKLSELDNDDDVGISYDDNQDEIIDYNDVDDFTEDASGPQSTMNTSTTPADFDSFTHDEVGIVEPEEYKNIDVLSPEEVDEYKDEIVYLGEDKKEISEILEVIREGRDLDDLIKVILSKYKEQKNVPKSRYLFTNNFREDLKLNKNDKIYESKGYKLIFNEKEGGVSLLRSTNLFFEENKYFAESFLNRNNGDKQDTSDVFAKMKAWDNIQTKPGQNKNSVFTAKQESVNDNKLKQSIKKYLGSKNIQTDLKDINLVNESVFDKTLKNEKATWLETVKAKNGNVFKVGIFGDEFILVNKIK